MVVWRKNVKKSYYAYLLRFHKVMEDSAIGEKRFKIHLTKKKIQKLCTLPAGLVKLTVSESQVPVVVVTCAILNVSKSSLIWQIAEKKLADNRCMYFLAKKVWVFITIFEVRWSSFISASLPLSGINCWVTRIGNIAVILKYRINTDITPSIRT